MDYGVDLSPGPWIVEYDYCDCSEYGCSHGRWPYAIYGPSRSDGKSWPITEFAELTEGDARLMAAAPSLLSLLERAVAATPEGEIAAELRCLMDIVLERKNRL